MLWISLKRIFKSGFINFWRNSIVAIASILVLTVTLFVIGSLILGTAFLNRTLENIQERVDISVSFRADAPERTILDLKSSLELLPEVRDVTYSSRDQELKAFKERHKDNALLMQSIDEVGNPFGARLSILANDPSQYEAIARFLNNYESESPNQQAIIDQISFKKDIVDKMVSIIGTSRKIGLAISILLILMSVLVTFNTVSLAIYSSREEISVMRLVGATNFYIRGPFVIEGMISGMIASFIALILLYPSTIWIKNATASVYGGVNLVSFYVTNFGQIFLVLLVSGILLGLVSSYLAIRRYLRV